MGVFDKIADFFTPNEDKIAAAGQTITAGIGARHSESPSFGSSSSSSKSSFGGSSESSYTPPAKTWSFGASGNSGRSSVNFGSSNGRTGAGWARQAAAERAGFNSGGGVEPLSSNGRTSAGWTRQSAAERFGIPAARSRGDIEADTWGATGEVARRIYDNDKANGLNFGKLTPTQAANLRAYYGMFSDREVENLYNGLKNFKQTEDGPDFYTLYKSTMGTLDRWLDEAADQYGKDSSEYIALDTIINRDFNKLGIGYKSDEVSQQRSNVSDQMDAGIQDIFAGVINQPGFDRKAAAGLAELEKTSWYKHNAAHASDLQKRLLGYTMATEGMSGVKEMFNDYLGETLNYMKAADDFISDLASDTKLGRFWEADKANFAAALDGQWWGGTKQTFTNTKADRSDRTLVGGYTIDDAIDNSLREELGDIANSPEFQYYGGAGFNEMVMSGTAGEWLDEARKNASALQKQFLGYVYAATNGDVNAVAEAWDGIQEIGDNIWETVNGANSLPTRASSIEGQMYRDYLGMRGDKKPSWLGNPSDEDEMTVAQMVWDMALTTRAQYPQIAANIAGAYLGGPWAGRILGSAVMATSVYGNSYKEAVDQGYTGKAAVGYASTQALSEFAVGVLLGGVGAASGYLTGKAGETFVKNIANPFVRAIIDTGVRSLGEGAEEYVQEIAEPLIRNFWFGEDNDFEIFNEEAAYSFFLGAASAFLMAPGGQEINTRINQSKLGKALNTQNSTTKLVDAVLAGSDEGLTKAQKEFYSQAKDIAQGIKDGKIKASDVNVGEMAEAAGRAGVDLDFLTNPETVTYTKEQLTTADLNAGVVSRLAQLDGDTSLAENIVKMYNGEQVDAEVKAQIENDLKAQTVLNELKGDLDINNAQNALTQAARVSQMPGELAKRAAAVKDNAPNKVILSPVEEYLKTEGMNVADSQKVGTILNKVLDGKPITKAEAKLISMKKNPIRAALLTHFDLDFDENASADKVMEALNKKAEEVAKTKDMQAGVKKATKTAGKTNRRKTNGRTQKNGTQAQGAGAVAGAGPEGGADVGRGAGPSAAPAVEGAPQRQSASGSRTRNRVTPGPVSVDKLTPEQRNSQRRAASNGFGSVIFEAGEDSGAVFDEEHGVWKVQIRVDGVFTEDQYVDHETGHLWIKALTAEARKDFLLKIRAAFGSDFEQAFSQVMALYTSKGYLTSDDLYGIIEEMYCLARAGQDFSGKAKNGRKIKGPCTFNFSQYQDAVMQIESDFHLEALAQNDLSDPAVAEMVKNGNYNQEFYRQQGYIEEEAAPAPVKTEEKAAPKTEKKKPTPIPSKKQAEEKKASRKEKTTEEKAKSSKAWNYDNEDDINKLYDQRKAAAQKAFDEGKRFQLGKDATQADRQAALDLELEQLDQMRELTLNHLREQQKQGKAESVANKKKGKRSAQAQSVIDRLGKGETVSTDEIEKIPEVADALNKQAERSGKPLTEEEILSTAQQAIDRGNTGKNAYHGEIAKEHKAEVVIGLPGSGKSSVFTDGLSNENRARVIDTDDFRDLIPDYNGVNAYATHHDAHAVREEIFNRSVSEGENIILATVGNDYDSLRDTILALKEQGYTVSLRYVDLPVEKAMGRAISRFIAEDGTAGRFIDPALIAKYGNSVSENYQRLIAEKGLLHGYSSYSNDTQEGQQPILLTSSDDRGASEGVRRQRGRGAHEEATRRARKSEGKEREVSKSKKSNAAKAFVKNETATATDAVTTTRNAIADEIQQLAERLKTDPEAATEVLNRMLELESQLKDLDSRLASAEKEAEKPAVKTKKEKSNAARAFKSADETFDYDKELQKLKDNLERRKASQKKKLETNPNKSEESYNAQLKKIQDEFDYEKARLDAKRRQIEEAQKKAEERKAKANKEQHSAEPETMEEENERREERNPTQLSGAYISPETTSAFAGPDAYAREYLAAHKEASTFVPGDPESVKNARGYLQARAKDQLVREGGRIVSEEDVAPEAREHADLIHQMLPNCDVAFFYNPDTDTVAAFINSGVEKVDGGIFINAAAYEDPGLISALEEDGLTTQQGIEHEISHYYLFYASPTIEDYLSGKTAVNLFNYVVKNLQGTEADKELAMEVMEEAYSEYGYTYYEEKDQKVIEEMFSDIFAGINREFTEYPEIFSEIRNLTQQWFTQNTGFGKLSEDQRVQFSADPEIEELMDRSDELQRSGHSETDAQVFQNNLNTEGVDSSSYDSQMEVLMAELENAKPDEVEGIYAKIQALQNENFEDTDELKAGRAEDLEKDKVAEEKAAKKKKTEKPVIPPKAETKPTKVDPNGPSAKVQAETIRLLEMMDDPDLGHYGSESEIWNEILKVQGLDPAKESSYDKVWTPPGTPQPEAPKAEPAKAGPSSTPKAETKKPTPIPPKAAPAPTETKSAPKSESSAELTRPKLHRGNNPVDVQGLDKRPAIERVVNAKMSFTAWYEQEKAKLDKQLDDHELNDEQYAQKWKKLTEDRDKALARYNDQLKRLEAMEEKETVKTKATVIKDKTTTYATKAGEWWKKIGKADGVAIRRRRSDRNTYDVRLTDSKGNTVYYDEVSPSMLEKALGERWQSKQTAKDRLATPYEKTTDNLGEWQTVNTVAPAKTAAEKADRERNNYGQKIPAKMADRMAQSTVRDKQGRLECVYRLGPANGVRNVDINAKYTLWSEKPATMNLRRGLDGVEAYDQVGKSSGDKIAALFQEMAEHPQMQERTKDVIRGRIANLERENREYSTRITRLDPWRPGYVSPKRDAVVGNKTVLEGYIDIRKPLIVDAKGRTMGFVEKTALEFANDPKNLANQVDADGNPMGEYDGIKFINVKVTDGDQTLGGGMLDTDTVYATFRHNQGKSTYNTDPTDESLMQYAADPDTETGFEEGTLEDTILKVLREKDYDTAIETLALYLSQYLQTGKIPDLREERTRNIFRAKMSDAERKIMEAKAKELVDQYGRLEPGMKPAREVFVPKKTPDGNVRRGYRTAMESEHTPEWGVDYVLRDALTREDAVYESVTDKSAIAAADRDMRNKGFTKMYAELKAKMDSEAAYKIDKKDIARAVRLYSEAFAVGDTETALDIMAEIAEAATTAGQVVQAMKLIKNMPKSSQLYYMRRVVQRMNQQYAKQIDSGRMSELTIEKQYAQAVLRATTQEELNEAMDALIKHVADQIPSTFKDKWNAWRYLSMLGNPKTHIRNILGNGIFVPVKFAKDLVAAGLESTFIKDQTQRRTSIKGLIGGKANAEYRAYAERDFEGVKDELQSGGKYNPENKIQDARTIFNNKFLEWYRRKNGDLLEGEDGKFLKFHYVNALTNFLATQGMSVEDLESTKEGRKIMSAARMYAFNEAQKATYRDASQMASALNQMKRNSGMGGILLEGVLPFTKTPINILKRGVEYSPVGLLKSLTADLAKVKSGEISANECIDNAAAGLTGTGVMMLGLWLASMGLLRGGDDDDEKKDDFEKMQGYQNYSLNLGNYNYTIDWAAPVALPLFVGCELFNEFQENNELTIGDWFNLATVVAEPITQLSMLSGLNDLMKSGKWDDNALQSALITSGSSYITQALPTIVAQISRSLSADRRTTYVDKNSDVPQSLQRWWQTNVLGKTPLNSQRTEYIDAWGRKDTSTSIVGRWVENILSPGYLNRIKSDYVDDELTRLANEVGTGVLMTAPEKSITVNNQTRHLTADQYATYTKARGDAARRMYGELFNSQGYQNEMSDSEKAYVVNLLRQYANVIGKQAIFDDYDPDDDNWAEKCDGDTTRVLNTAMLKARAHDLGVKYDDSSPFFQLIISSDWLSPVDQAYAIAQMLSLSNDNVYINGEKQKPTAEMKDMIAEHYRQIFPAYYMDLIMTSQWLSADLEQRTKLLSSARSEAKSDSKKWLSQVLSK